MDISFYLVEFIISKDQVIVPGLGKFYKNRIAGFLDQKTEIYYPPQQTINFTSEYFHEDKLVQFISEKSGISLTSAYAHLDEYVKDLKFAIKNGEFEIPGLGILSTKEDSIFFEALKSIKINDDFFGLSPIEIKQNHLAINATEKAIPLVVKLTEEKEENPGKEENYSLADQALLTAIEDEEEKKSNNVLQYVLIFIILAIVSGDTYLYYRQPETFKSLFSVAIKAPEKIQAPKENQIKVADSSELKKADSIYNQSDISSDLEARGFEVEKENAKDSTAISIKKKLIPKKPTIRYEIIIGLYLKKNDAIKRVALLKSNGINAFIVEDSDGPMIKISTATFYDEAAANKELKRIREDINPEAFIKPVKNLY